MRTPPRLARKPSRTKVVARGGYAVAIGPLPEMSREALSARRADWGHLMWDRSDIMAQMEKLPVDWCLLDNLGPREPPQVSLSWRVVTPLPRDTPNPTDECSRERLGNFTPFLLAGGHESFEDSRPCLPRDGLHRLRGMGIDRSTLLVLLVPRRTKQDLNHDSHRLSRGRSIHPATMPEQHGNPPQRAA
jgi:hypothetical protein